MNKKKLVGIGIAAVAVVAVVLLAVFVIVPMFGGKQVTKVKDALFKTLESKSMTVKMISDNDQVSKLKVEYSEDDETLYIQISAEESAYTRYYIIEEKAIYMAIYNEEEEEVSVRQLEMDDDALLSKVLLAMFAGEKELYEALEGTKVEESLEKLGYELDLDNLQEFVDEMVDTFEEKENLEECLDAETKKEDGETKYVFKPDVYKTVALAMKTSKSRFEDKDVYDKLREDWKDEKDEFDDFDLKITVSVDKGVLTGIDIKVDDDGDEGRTRYKFSDVGSTNVSLPKEVKDALKDAKEKNEESQEDKDSEEAEDTKGNAVAVPVN